MEEFRWLNSERITLYFSPKPSEKIESVSIVSDRELSSIASGSTKETNLILSIMRDAVSKSREWCISKDLQFFKRHVLLI